MQKDKWVSGPGNKFSSSLLPVFSKFPIIVCIILYNKGECESMPTLMFLLRTPFFFLPALLALLCWCYRNKHATNYDVCVRPQWPGEGLCALRVRLHLTGWDCRICLWVGGCFGNCLPNECVLYVTTIIFQAGLFIVVIVVVCQAQ